MKYPSLAWHIATEHKQIPPIFVISLFITKAIISHDMLVIAQLSFRNTCEVSFLYKQFQGKPIQKVQIVLCELI